MILKVFMAKVVFGLLLLVAISAQAAPQAFDGERPTQDGFPMDVSKFDPHLVANPVPQEEPISAFVNPESYEVFGKTYYVLKTSKGYKKRGIASWYGTKFHGQMTSTGEPYDMFAMTAASKVLPIPTYVRVKNLENGREVIVKVNDRGPFHHERIIDLSYTAAAKLGVLGKGTAPVEVVALTPYQSIDNVDKDHFYVQAGAFSNLANAKKLTEQIEPLTTSPVLIKSISEMNDALYRVQIGPFNNLTERNAFLVTLADAGIQQAMTVK